MEIKDQLRELKADLSQISDKINYILSSIDEKDSRGEVENTHVNMDLFYLMNGVPNSLRKNKPYTKIPAGLTIEQIGRQGEIAFQDYLHDILSKYVTIKWMNQGYESKKPYDFTVEIQGEIYFIDVKATRGEFDQILFLSPSELKFALDNPGKYFIARLSQFENTNDNYKASSFNVKLLTFREALELIKKLN